MLSRNVMFFVLVIIVGALIGSFLGKFVEKAFPDSSMLGELFATEINAGLAPTNLDLRVVELTFGCLVKLNITAVLGMIIAGYIFRVMLKKK